MRSIWRRRYLLGRERQYNPCISISARCWSDSSVKLLGFRVSIGKYMRLKLDIPDKAIAPRDACQGIQHNLGTLAAEEGSDKLWFSVIAQPEDWIAENSHKVRIGGLWRQIADKNAVLFGILLRRSGRLRSGHSGESGRCWGGRSDGGRPVHDKRL